jgi:hypothetical protein
LKDSGPLFLRRIKVVTITLKKFIPGTKRLAMSIPDKWIDRVYTVPFFNGRAFRNSDVVASLIEKAKKGESFSPEEVDSCCEWFISVFNNQFTLDELLDGYDADSLIPDIFAAYMAMANGVSKVLTEFPIPPTVNQTKNQ